MIQEERPSEIWDEILPMLHAHYEEVGHYKDIPLDPDKSVYLAMEEAGAIKVYTVREEGKLIGYAAYFIRKHPHHKDSLQASQDIIYVDPKHRGGVGKRLIKECDERLRELGVQVVYSHLKAKHNFGPMLERMGYELQDLIYSRRLDL